MMTQSLMLAKKPHIIIGRNKTIFSVSFIFAFRRVLNNACLLYLVTATPGRLVDHLENTKGFNLRALKYLVRQSCHV